MEVKVRGVEESAIQTIDRSARAQGISRNQYLVSLINRSAVDQTAIETESRFRVLLDMVIEQMKRAYRCRKSASM